MRWRLKGWKRGTSRTNGRANEPNNAIVSAGVTIYVAATDLVPEVNREPGIKMALVFFVGVVVFFLLRLLGPG